MSIEKIGSPTASGVKPSGLLNTDFSIGKNDSDGDKFSQILQDQISKTSSVENESSESLGIKFSNHAVERMRSRGISFTPETLQKIDDAVVKADQKGVKEALVMSDNSAMIVNIENKTVVTVMDKAALKDNVFTQIDAAVIV